MEVHDEDILLAIKAGATAGLFWTAARHNQGATMLWASTAEPFHHGATQHLDAMIERLGVQAQPSTRLVADDRD